MPTYAIEFLASRPGRAAITPEERASLESTISGVMNDADLGESLTVTGLPGTEVLSVSVTVPGEEAAVSRLSAMIQVALADWVLEPVPAR